MAFAGFSLPLGEFAGTQGDVVLGLRPGSFELAGPWTDPELTRMPVEAEIVEALGDEALVSFRVDAPAVQVEEVRTDEGRLLADDPARASSRACAGAWTSGPASSSSSRSTTASSTSSTRRAAELSGNRLAQPTRARNLRVSRRGLDRAVERVAATTRRRRARRGSRRARSRRCRPGSEPSRGRRGAEASPSEVASSIPSVPWVMAAATAPPAARSVLGGADPELVGLLGVDLHEVGAGRQRRGGAPLR